MKKLFTLLVGKKSNLPFFIFMPIYMLIKLNFDLSNNVLWMLFVSLFLLSIFISKNIEKREKINIDIQ